MNYGVLKYISHTKNVDTSGDSWRMVSSHTYPRALSLLRKKESCGRMKSRRPWKTLCSEIVGNNVKRLHICFLILTRLSYRSQWFGASWRPVVNATVAADGDGGSSPTPHPRLPLDVQDIVYRRLPLRPRVEQSSPVRPLRRRCQMLPMLIGAQKSLSPCRPAA